MCISKIQTMQRLSCSEVCPDLLFSAIKLYEDMNIQFIDKNLTLNIDVNIDNIDKN